MVDWKTYIGDKSWPDNFKEPQSKWGYLNNPRWQTSPQTKVSYTGNESNEPQVWTLPGDNDHTDYLLGTSVNHTPCGHWHKIAIPTVTPPKIYVCDETRGKTIIFAENYLFSNEFSSLGRAISIYEDEVYTLSYSGVVNVYSLDGVYQRTMGPHLDTNFGIGIMSDQVFVADPTSDGGISVYTTAGVYQKKITTYRNLGGSIAGSYGVALTTDRIYALDGFRVQVYDLEGNYKTYFGSYGSGVGKLNGAYRGQIYNDQLYILNANNNNVSVWSPGGVFQEEIAISGAGVKKGIYIYDDKIFIVFEVGGQCVRVYEMDGTLLDTFGSSGNDPGEFTKPLDIYVYP